MSGEADSQGLEQSRFEDARQIVVRYAIGGVLFGACFPLIAWTVDLALSGDSWTFASIVRLHEGNLVYSIVDTAPLILGSVFAYMGRLQSRATAHGLLLADVMANMDGGVFALSPDLILVTRNSRLFDMLGLDQNIVQPGEHVEPIFRTLAERGDFGDVDVDLQVDRILTDLGNITDRRKETSSHGGRIIETRYSRLPDGQIVGIITDVTEAHQIRREVQARNAILTTVLDSLDQGIVAFDKDLRMIAWNEKLRALRDYPPELVGEGVAFEELMRHDVARNEFGPGDPEETLQNKIATARNFNRHAFERQRSDGSYIEVRGGPLPDGGFVSTFADITARKEVEREVAEKEALLRRAMDNMTDGMYVLDAEGRYLVFNDRYLDLIDIPKETVKVGGLHEDVIKRMATDGYFGPGDVDAIVSERVSFLKTEHYDEKEIISPDGRVILARKSPVRHGGCVVSLTDVSAQKKAEAVLRNAKDHAEALADAKTQFVAVVSHEVRTPMNGVLGMARLLRDSHLAPEHAENVKVIISASESLVRILDDLLDLSKLEADKIEYDAAPFLPVDIAEHAVALLSGVTREKGLVLQHTVSDDVPAVLIGDPHRIRQILVNLISNAVKFAEQGTVSLAIDLVGEEGGTAVVRFAVTDQGKGIAPETRKKLFSAYEQGGAQVARKYGGTGLGLTISRQLVEGMGGALEVDSEIGVGSTFHFDLKLPVDHETDPATLRDTSGISSERTAMRKGDRPLNILQVEDDEISRTVVEKTLTRVGHSVRSVADGNEALVMLEKRNFDLILMDRHMPGLNGIETTRRIRAMKGLAADLPIIGITAGAREDELQECLDAGFNLVLTKPVDGAELCATIGRLAQSTSRAPILSADQPVLVVDDTPINLIVAEAQLTRLGLECQVVGSGAEALKAYASNDYAAVLVDIMMPGMDGIELTQAIRELEEEKEFDRRPVIAMTGFVDDGEEKAFREAGGDDFLVKPVVYEDLSASLSHWLHAAELEALEKASQALGDRGDPVELDKLGEIIGTNDTKALEDVLKLLLKHLDPLAKTLRAAWERRDREALKEAAHTAKGAAANAAATTLHTQVKELEAASLEGDWSWMEIQILSIEREFRRVEAFIHETVR